MCESYSRLQAVLFPIRIDIKNTEQATPTSNGHYASTRDKTTCDSRELSLANADTNVSVTSPGVSLETVFELCFGGEQLYSSEHTLNTWRKFA